MNLNCVQPKFWVWLNQIYLSNTFAEEDNEDRESSWGHSGWPSTDSVPQSYGSSVSLSFLVGVAIVVAPSAAFGCIVSLCGRLHMKAFSRLVPQCRAKCSTCFKTHEQECGSRCVWVYVCGWEAGRGGWFYNVILCT